MKVWPSRGGDHETSKIVIFQENSDKLEISIDYLITYVPYRPQTAGQHNRVVCPISAFSIDTCEKLTYTIFEWYPT